jgi:hypothetical protein
MARWSLGEFGDLLWDTAPDLRPAIQVLVRDKIRLAIDLDEEIEQPNAFDFGTSVIGRLLDEMDAGRASTESIAQLGRFIRAALDTGREGLTTDLYLYVLENMDSSTIVAKMFIADPEAVAAVHRHCGLWRE